MHNYPRYAGWQKDFAAKGVTIIGVHTPETDGEKKLDALRAQIKKHNIDYALAADTAGKTWAAWGNRWWASVYLIDKKGNMRYRSDGELNWDKFDGEKVMRKKIAELMAEKE